MATVQYNCDFKHPFIRVEWQHRALGTTSWLPVDSVFGDAVNDQAGNTIIIDLDTLPGPIDDFYGHVRAQAWAADGTTAVTQEAALSAALDVFVSPLQVVIEGGRADPWVEWDFSRYGYNADLFEHYRMSPATVRQADDTVDVLAIDEPGIVTGVGIQLERAATNYIPSRSGSVGWIVPVGLNADQFHLAILAPDGTLSCVHIYPDTPGWKTNYQVTLADGTTEVGEGTLSIWLRALDGDTTTQHTLHNATGYPDEARVDLTDTWLFKSLPNDSTAHYYAVDGRHATADGGQLVVWGEQAETTTHSTSYIYPVNDSPTQRAASFLFADLAAAELNITKALSFQVKSEVEFISGVVTIIAALQSNAPGEAQGDNLFYLYKDVDDLLYIGGRYSGDWKASSPGPAVTTGRQLMNARGRIDNISVANTCVGDVWFNDDYHQFTIADAKWNEIFTHMGIHQRNEMEAFALTGICEKIRLSDQDLEDSVIEGWD